MPLSPGCTAIAPVVLRYRRRGVAVEVRGLSEQRAALLRRLAVHDAPGALTLSAGH